MVALIKTELYKIYTRPRTYIAYAAIFVLVIAIQLGIKMEGQKLIDFTTQNLQENFDFQGNLLNGYLIAFFILNTLYIHIPFLVALIAGDVIAGEANSGTFRIILTRPVSRVKLITAKYLATLIYTISLVVLLGILCLALSVIWFGKGDLIVIKDGINIFNADDVMWRFMFALTYGILAMVTIASVAFFLSSFADNGIAPIVGTMAIVIAFTVFSTLNLGLFNSIRPFLFTTYLNEWRSVFSYEIDWKSINISIAVLTFHVTGLFGLTLYLFNKKDILS